MGYVLMISVCKAIKNPEIIKTFLLKNRKKMLIQLYETPYFG